MTDVVNLVWLIPACAARLIKETMKTKQPDFHEMNIQELIVNGEVLFSVMYLILQVRGIGCVFGYYIQFDLQRETDHWLQTSANSMTRKEFSGS